MWLNIFQHDLWTALMAKSLKRFNDRRTKADDMKNHLNMHKVNAKETIKIKTQL